MKKRQLYLFVFLLLILFVQTGCNSNTTSVASVNANMAPAAEVSSKRPDSNEIVNRFFECRKTYDISGLQSLFWDESLEAFDMSPSDIDKNITKDNYKLIEFKNDGYSELPNDFDIEAREYLVYSKEYNKGDYSEGYYDLILVNDKDEGWKISEKGYLGTSDLGFKERSVAYNQLYAIPYIKFAPRVIIYCKDSLYAKLDLLFDKNRGYINTSLCTCEEVEELKTKSTQLLIVSQDNKEYKGNLGAKNISWSGYNGKISVYTDKFFVKMDKPSDKIIIPKTIKILNMNGIDGNNINIMKNGGYLIAQISDK